MDVPPALCGNALHAAFSFARCTAENLTALALERVWPAFYPTSESSPALRCHQGSDEPPSPEGVAFPAAIETCRALDAGTIHKDLDITIANLLGKADLSIIG